MLEKMDSIKSFLKTTGLDILIALLAGLITFAVMLILKKKFLKPLLNREKLSSFGKPIMALFGLIAFVVSAIVALVSLLLLNNWFLFTLSILLIVGLVWSFKHLIVDIISAARIIMDMGTVHGGQRVVINGIPWCIKKMGIRTHLVNETLQGGHISIRMSKLKELISRNVVDGEPWFPTRKGEFVMLADGTYGQVVVQTPEQVVLLIGGKTRKTYLTANFLAEKPQNLSDGFVITATVALDYNCQKKLPSIIDIFQKGLQEKLMTDNFTVEFNDAGIDSLNLIVIASYEGAMAGKYLALHRLLQYSIVDICVRNNLNIPFRQLTVHMDKGI